MLQSFIGTFDAAGLRSLRNEDNVAGRMTLRQTGTAPFWVVLDTDELPSIQQALCKGHRAEALALVMQQAKSLGRLLD